MFRKYFKGVSKKIEGCFDPRKLQGYLKEVQRMFQGSFKDILRNFKVCLEKVSSEFQENFKSFKVVSRMIQ